MPIVACASPMYLDAHGYPADPDDLSDHACILDTNLPVREVWRFSHHGQIISIRMSPILSVNSALAVREALLAGLGIGLCPEFVVARSIARGELVSLFEARPDYSFAMHLVYPHRLHLSAKVRAFVDFAMDWYSPVPPWRRDSYEIARSAPFAPA